MDRLREMVRLAESIGLVVLVDPDEFTLKTLVLPCRDQETGIRVDFIFSWSNYENQALDRSRSLELDGVPVKFTSLEDLVIHKIIAGRPRDLEALRLLLYPRMTPFPQSFTQAPASRRINLLSRRYRRRRQ